MAEVLWFNGFGRGVHANSADHSPVNVLPERDTTYYKTAPASINFRSGSDPYRTNWLRHKWPILTNEPSVSVYVYPRDWYAQSSTEGLPMIQLRLGDDGFVGSNYLNFRWNYDTKTYDFYINDSLQAVGNIVAASNDFFNVQIYCVLDVSGYVGMLIDGHTSIEENLDLSALGGQAHYCYLHGGKYFLGGPIRCNYDNWVIGRGGFLGDCRVEEYYPDSDVTTQYTGHPTPGADQYTNIDEELLNEDDYNWSQSDGDVNEHGVENFVPTTDNGINKEIRAIMPWVEAKIDVATGEHLKVGVNSNGNIDVDTLPLFVNHKHLVHVLETDPNTGLAWTEDGFNAVLLRYESEIGGGS